MVDTSLFSVINFLCDLFCFIEIEYAEQFVENIRKMYGISYREKYKRAVRDRPREEVQLDVVGKELFRLFFQENVRMDLFSRETLMSSSNITAELSSTRSMRACNAIGPTSSATGSSSPGH